MGITIKSLNKSIDLGYIGFDKLRTKIAGLTNKEIEELYKLYNEVDFIFDEDEKKRFFECYNEELRKLDEKYNNKYNLILYFLYAPDDSATISVDTCKKLYEIIKDYDDCIKYGYAGQEDCATFKDFKELVKDCIDNNTEMKWS